MKHLLAVISLGLIAALSPSADAHETDQYTLPLGQEFADLRLHFSRMVHDAIAAAVQTTNAEIRKSLANGKPTWDTSWYQSPGFIAGQVWYEVFAAMPTNEMLDAELGVETTRMRYPGLVVVYRPEQLIYDDPLLLIDITKFVRTFFRSSSVNVGGTLFGTDKFLHFFHLGRIYHAEYLEARAEGLDEAQALTRTVDVSAGANPFLSENGFLGTISTGIRSNGDLAADYAGFKFYRNLTEPVRIGERPLPPMLERDGVYWRLGNRVQPGSDFFAVFVTPHFNEALNPNGYLGPVGERVQAVLRERCYDLLDWYRDARGRLRTREQFEALEQDLSTFYGEPYGYRNDGPDRVSIATTCFEGGAARPDDAAASAPAGSWPGSDRFGRTALWWAAREGQLDTVRQLIDAAENPNARDIDGEAPLHAAARGGHAAVIARLLRHGADPGAGDRYGTMPLHLAVESGEAASVQALLEAGATVNARDQFGRMPLHQAILQGDRALAALLLDHGADRGARYLRRTPAQLAARAGNVALGEWLASYQPAAQRRLAASRGR
ncbi:MAG TPA: ankyrin repeat domain-containing protein [Burkholderiales bacterium]|nr:ankyrin repeat domain-containing protein [Burkholderiales bacterium]